MKICRPTQDIVFQCLASNCPDNCCTGWEIPVDGESAARWKQLPSPWNRVMAQSLIQTDGEWQLKRKSGRCVLLDENRLCRLYAACGAEALCRTCYWHPRFVAEYGGLREIMPGLSCPAWAKLYLMSDEPVSFVTEDTDELPGYNTIHAEHFYLLKKGREKAFTLLQNRNLPLGRRMEELLLLAEKLDGVHEEEEAILPVLPAYRKKLLGLEILTEQWRTILTTPHPYADAPWREIVGERLLTYYVFRFWLRGVYNGSVLPWAKLAVWSCIVVFALGCSCEKREDFCEVVRLYSKEIEHDQENLDALFRVLCRHSGRYSISGLLRAWEEIGCC